MRIWLAANLSAVMRYTSRPVLFYGLVFRDWGIGVFRTKRGIGSELGSERPENRAPHAR